MIVDPARDLEYPGAHVATGREDSVKVGLYLSGGGVLILRPTSTTAVPRAVAVGVRLALAARCGVMVDEAHLAMDGGKPHIALLDAITMARHHGVAVLLVTQAPQGLRGLGLHSGATIYCFKMPMGGPWLRTHGLPEDAFRALSSAPAHSFLRLDMDGRLTGPHRL